MPIDVRPLWDFSDPAASERRFRDAAAAAEGDAALIYETQVARTHGLRRDFERAREVLAGLEPRLAAAGLEARAWYALELGRAFVSAAHSDDEVTEEARATAREAFQTAHDLARAASCDAVAVDALHMMAFVDSAPEAALEWGRKALALVDASDQPDARRWEASLRNNTGYALHQLGRYEEALDDFRKAAALREAGTDAAATRAAHWMVAWTLRSLQRFEEALAIQLRLEAECDAAGEPDSYVYEELELLYRGLGQDDDADRYAARLRNAGPDRG
jgi:tetratricopeptide (TPR) repeat protein